MQICWFSVRLSQRVLKLCLAHPKYGVGDFLEAVRFYLPFEIFIQSFNVVYLAQRCGESIKVVIV